MVISYVDKPNDFIILKVLSRALCPKWSFMYLISRKADGLDSAIKDSIFSSSENRLFLYMSVGSVPL